MLYSTKILIIFSLALICFLSSFKTGNNIDRSASVKDTLYAVIYTTGLNWDHSKPANLQPYFKSHSNFLFDLRNAGTIKIGARYSDKGMIIIESENYSKAISIIEKDSALVFKTFKAEIFPFNAFFKGCIE